MSLTRTQVEGIAHLARLEITEAQMPVYVDSLSRIIDFVEQLAAADTAGVEPMAHPLADQVQRLRPDAVSETDQREKFQRTRRASPPGFTSCPRSSSDEATVMVPFPGAIARFCAGTVNPGTFSSLFAVNDPCTH